MKIKNNKGFTLIEVLVVVAILSAIMGAMSLTINTVLLNHNLARDEAIRLRQIENAGYAISRDIMSAKSVDVINATSIKLTRYHWDGSANSMVDQEVIYDWSSGNLMKTIDGTVSQLVATYIVADPEKTRLEAVDDNEYKLDICVQYKGETRCGSYQIEQRYPSTT